MRVGTTFDESEVPEFARMLRLDGRVFVVLGAGQGIGRQTAHALAQCGALVVCVGRRPEPTERVAEQVGGRAFVGDAQDRSTMVRLVANSEAAYGRLDGVVNVIGMGIASTALEVSDDDWHWQYDNVLAASLLALQIGGPAIARSGGGSITFVSSLAGQRAFAGLPLAAYGTAKAALDHLTRIAAVELGSQDVRVNAISPGLTKTPRNVEHRDEAFFEEAARNYPLLRVSEPADMAAGILFLVSDLARNVTGQVLVIDGGLTLLAPSPIVIGGQGHGRPTEPGRASA